MVYSCVVATYQVAINTTEDWEAIWSTGDYNDVGSFTSWRYSCKGTTDIESTSYVDPGIRVG